MSKYFNKFSAAILLVIFIILFSLTVYSLISSNEIVRDAELIQYLIIADFTFLLILLIYLSIFLINYVKSRKREVIGLRLFNKFFLFFGLFSIIPSGIILLASAIFFNIEMSTWLGPAFKSTVNNSYQLAQKYIDQTERNLIKDVIQKAATTSRLTGGMHLDIPITNYTVTYLYREPEKVPFIRGWHAIQKGALYLPTVFLEHTYDNGDWIESGDTMWPEGNKFNLNPTFKKLNIKYGRYNPNNKIRKIKKRCTIYKN